MEEKRNKGEELAKVLWYYNLIPTTSVLKQKIICPFHEDMNPSMIVNLDEGNWFCFGCNKSGDAKEFVRQFEKKYNGLNDLKSYKVYLNILKSNKVSNIHLDNHRIKSKGPRSDSKEHLNIAKDYYYGLKTINWWTSKEPEMIYARNYMNERGFNPKTLNIIKAKITYNKSYGIIFPMLDNGEFKGWVCRTMNKDIEKRRKYLYNEGFSRATTLVGNYGKKDYVIVVEGFMDRLKFIQFGISNVVAILGWKMSDEQIKKLKDKGVTKIICALDNDECGKKGYKYLKQHFEVTRFKYLKGIKDPGEMDKDNFIKMYKRTMEEFRKNSGGGK